MTDNGEIAVTWFAHYLGLGYLLDRRGWHIFPIFKEASEARQVWDECVDPLDETGLRMRFVELDGEYEFILYSEPFSKEKPNFGFYRRFDISQNYGVFKQRCTGTAFFRFGVLRAGQSPLVFKKFKVVTNIKFMKREEIAKGSPEWWAREAQRLARKDEAYRI
jgi:hypothetical protein